MRRTNRLQSLEPRHLLAGDVPVGVVHDLNRDGSVDPADALVVINAIRAERLAEGEVVANLAHDISGDGQVDTLDALTLINRIRSDRQFGFGGAESAALDNLFAGGDWLAEGGSGNVGQWIDALADGRLPSELADSPIAGLAGTLLSNLPDDFDGFLDRAGRFVELVDQAREDAEISADERTQIRDFVLGELDDLGVDVEGILATVRSEMEIIREDLTRIADSVDAALADGGLSLVEQISIGAEIFEFVNTTIDRLRDVAIGGQSFDAS